MMWQVEVRRFTDGAVEKVLGLYQSERKAERVEDGLNINLNHDDFYTKIVATHPTTPSEDATNE